MWLCSQFSISPKKRRLVGQFRIQKYEQYIRLHSQNIPKIFRSVIYYFLFVQMSTTKPILCPLCSDLCSVNSRALRSMRSKEVLEKRYWESATAAGNAICQIVIVLVSMSSFFFPFLFETIVPKSISSSVPICFDTNKTG